MKSKITGANSILLFTTKVLNKYDVKYYKCVDTGFIQTEEPYWLEEAYTNAITKLDVGIVERNMKMANIVDRVLQLHFNSDKSFLDYAGGYGLFTRMMRDRGFDFFNTDKFCENIFAEFHDLAQLDGGIKFELVTAFEVFEHLANPIDEIGNMFKHSDNLLFSTELLPPNVCNEEDWWYFIPETGQHISLYTMQALKRIATHFNKFLYSDGIGVHLFTQNELAANPFESYNYDNDSFLIKKMREKLNRYDRRNKIILPTKKSLIDKDWNDAKNRKY